MPFDLATYDRSSLDGICACFNSETAFEPHIALLTPDRFIQLVESKSSFDPAGLFVARERGAVIGWIHACVAAGSEPGHRPEDRVPRIRMLIFPRARLAVGGALVRSATDWLKQTGQKELWALHARHGYPFYRGLWMGGEPMAPVTLPHVQLALEVGGYKVTQESIFMTAAMPSPPGQIVADAKLEMDEAPAAMRHEPMRESWIGFEPMRTRAMVGEEEVGGISWVVQPHLADRLGAPCMNIWGLGVKESYRRKRIASALIAHAMRSSYRRGARFASVGTQLWNAPAHATYARFGYVPHTLLVGRMLHLKEET